MLAIGMDFVEGDNLSLECFADRASFRFQVLAIRIEFVKGDNLLPKELFYQSRLQVLSACHRNRLR